MLQLYSPCIIVSVILFFYLNVNTLLYKYQLRGLYTIQKHKVVKSIIDYEYALIHKKIAQRATIGKRKASFTILCIIENENPPRSTISEIDQKIIVLQKSYNISLDYLRIQILDKLKHSFPMSTLIWEGNTNNTTNPNNCVCYTFIW